MACHARSKYSFGKFTLYNYIRENNFHAFSAHENIFTTKKANYGSSFVSIQWQMPGPFFLFTSLSQCTCSQSISFNYVSDNVFGTYTFQFCVTHAAKITVFEWCKFRMCIVYRTTSVFSVKIAFSTLSRAIHFMGSFKLSSLGCLK